MPTVPVRKHYSLTIKDFYSLYRKEKKKTMPCSDIHPYKVYRMVVEDFFEIVSKKIIYDHFTFMMPYSLGTLMTKPFKVNYKKAKIDYNASRIHKKPIKHINTHTHGYTFGVIWDKSYTRFKNNTYYHFKHISSKKATSKGIGKKGLSKHIIELSKDPTKRSYIRK